MRITAPLVPSCESSNCVNLRGTVGSPMPLTVQHHPSSYALRPFFQCSSLRVGGSAYLCQSSKQRIGSSLCPVIFTFVITLCVWLISGLRHAPRGRWDSIRLVSNVICGPLRSCGGKMRGVATSWDDLGVGSLRAMLLAKGLAPTSSPAIQRKSYSSRGVFTSRATADPSLVKSRAFQVSKTSAPAFTAQ